MKKQQFYTRKRVKLLFLFVHFPTKSHIQPFLHCTGKHADMLCFLVLKEAITGVRSVVLKGTFQVPGLMSHSQHVCRFFSNLQSLFSYLSFQPDNLHYAGGLMSSAHQMPYTVSTCRCAKESLRNISRSGEKGKSRELHSLSV